VVVLLETHEAYLRHDPGPHHPERPERLLAVRAGAERAGLGSGLVAVTPRPATTDELARVHGTGLIQTIEAAIADQRVRFDPDTVAGPGSWEAAVFAAGAGLDAVERLRRGEGDAAFCAVRPPGHHADNSWPRGFCLLNNIVVAAAALFDAGERVAIIDYDAHHGNGTQALVGGEPGVLYVSLHEYGPRVYPQSGGLAENAPGVINVPLASGTAGDAYAAAFARVIEPAVGAFQPDWLLVSAGFDGHRDDPQTDLGLVAADFAFLTARCVALAPAGRVVAFLEGGYDFDALVDSTQACVRALAGEEISRPSSNGGGRGMDVIDELELLRGSARRGI
jgi:acetoin utilization deacetylase AcuC-like enzyme